MPSQRAVFDLPRDVCYLNAASYDRCLLATVETARELGHLKALTGISPSRNKDTIRAVIKR
jgi:hypothetical protein